MLATPRPRPRPRKGKLPGEKALQSSKSTYMHIQETRHDTTRREETRRLDAIRRTHDKHNKTSTARHKHSRGQAQQDRHNTTGTTSHAQHDRHNMARARRLTSNRGYGVSPLGFVGFMEIREGGGRDRTSQPESTHGSALRFGLPAPLPLRRSSLHNRCRGADVPGDSGCDVVGIFVVLTGECCGHTGTAVLLRKG